MFCRVRAIRTTGAPQQSFDREPVIQLFTLPAGDCGAGCNFDLPRPVCRDELHPVHLAWCARSMALERLAVRPDETDSAVVQYLHDYSPLVHLPVMEAA